MDIDDITERDVEEERHYVSDENISHTDFQDMGDEEGEVSGAEDAASRFGENSDDDVSREAIEEDQMPDLPVNHFVQAADHSPDQEEGSDIENEYEFQVGEDLDEQPGDEGASLHSEQYPSDDQRVDVSSEGSQHDEHGNGVLTYGETSQEMIGSGFDQVAESGDDGEFGDEYGGEKVPGSEYDDESGDDERREGEEGLYDAKDDEFGEEAGIGDHGDVDPDACEEGDDEERLDESGVECDEDSEGKVSSDSEEDGEHPGDDGRRLIEGYDDASNGGFDEVATSGDDGEEYDESGEEDDGSERQVIEGYDDADDGGSDGGEGSSGEEDADNHDDDDDGERQVIEGYDDALDGGSDGGEGSSGEEDDDNHDDDDDGERQVIEGYDDADDGGSDGGEGSSGEEDDDNHDDDDDGERQVIEGYDDADDGGSDGGEGSSGEEDADNHDDDDDGERQVIEGYDDADDGGSDGGEGSSGEEDDDNHDDDDDGERQVIEGYDDADDGGSDGGEGSSGEEDDDNHDDDDDGERQVIEGYDDALDGGSDGGEGSSGEEDDDNHDDDDDGERQVIEGYDDADDGGSDGGEGSSGEEDDDNHDDDDDGERQVIEGYDDADDGGSDGGSSGEEDDDNHDDDDDGERQVIEGYDDADDGGSDGGEGSSGEEDDDNHDDDDDGERQVIEGYDDADDGGSDGGEGSSGEEDDDNHDDDDDGERQVIEGYDDADDGGSDGGEGSSGEEDDDNHDDDDDGERQVIEGYDDADDGGSDGGEGSSGEEDDDNHDDDDDGERQVIEGYDDADDGGSDGGEGSSGEEDDDNHDDDDDGERQVIEGYDDALDGGSDGGEGSSGEEDDDNHDDDDDGERQVIEGYDDADDGGSDGGEGSSGGRTQFRNNDGEQVPGESDFVHHEHDSVDTGLLGVKCDGDTINSNIQEPASPITNREEKEESSDLEIKDSPDCDRTKHEQRMESCILHEGPGHSEENLATTEPHINQGKTASPESSEHDELEEGPSTADKHSTESQEKTDASVAQESELHGQLDGEEREVKSTSKEGPTRRQTRSRTSASDEEDQEQEKEPEEEGDEDDAGWRDDGHPYLHRRVRRSIWDGGIVTSFADGRVTGWLPKEESDFLDDSGAPAPLWHVVYDSGELKGDEEDLEENEILESLPKEEAVLAKHLADEFEYSVGGERLSDEDGSLPNFDSESFCGSLRSASRQSDASEKASGCDFDASDMDDDEDEVGDGVNESEYEQLRRKKMAENEAFMAQLGFDQERPTLARGRKRGPNKRRKKVIATRRSSRTSGREKVYDVNYLWRKLTRERDEAQRLLTLKRRQLKVAKHLTLEEYKALDKEARRAAHLEAKRAVQLEKERKRLDKLKALELKELQNLMRRAQRAANGIEKQMNKPVKRKHAHIARRPEWLSTLGPIESTLAHMIETSEKWVTAVKDDDHRYIPQVGDEVVYFQEAHRQQIDGDEFLSSLPPDQQLGPSWFAQPGSPHAVECVVSAVSYRFSQCWKQVVYDVFDRVLRPMETHRNSAWFKTPVDPVALGVPEYPKIIKNPMDFGTIRQRVESGSYTKFDMFASDCRLVLANAITFNKHADDPVHIAASKMSQILEEKLADAQATLASSTDPLVEMVVRLVPLYIMDQFKQRDPSQRRRFISTSTPPPTTSDEVELLTPATANSIRPSFVDEGNDQGEEDTSVSIEETARSTPASASSSRGSRRQPGRPRLSEPERERRLLERRQREREERERLQHEARRILATQTGRSIEELAVEAGTNRVRVVAPTDTPAPTSLTDLPDLKLATYGDGSLIAPFTVSFTPKRSPALVPRHLVLRSIEQSWRVGEQVAWHLSGNQIHRGEVLSVESRAEEIGDGFDHLPLWKAMRLKTEEAEVSINVWECLQDGSGRGEQADGQRPLTPIPPLNQPLLTELRHRSTASRLDGQSTRRLQLALKAVMSTSVASPFLALPTGAEDYTAFVPAPSHLQLVRERLSNGFYRSYDAVLADLERIYFNCAEFNEESSAIVRQAKLLVRLVISMCDSLYEGKSSKEREFADQWQYLLGSVVRNPAAGSTGPKLAVNGADVSERLKEAAMAFLKQPRAHAVAAELSLAKVLADSSTKTPPRPNTEPFLLRASRLMAFKVLDIYGGWELCDNDKAEEVSISIVNGELEPLRKKMTGPRALPLGISIGTKIKRYFKGYGSFIGTVTRFASPYFDIHYSDGDTEELTPRQVLQLKYSSAKLADGRKPRVIIRLGSRRFDTLSELPELPGEDEGQLVSSSSSSKTMEPVSSISPEERRLLREAARDAASASSSSSRKRKLASSKQPQSRKGSHSAKKERKAAEQRKSSSTKRGKASRTPQRSSQEAGGAVEEAMPPASKSSRRKSRGTTAEQGDDNRKRRRASSPNQAARKTTSSPSGRAKRTRRESTPAVDRKGRGSDTSRATRKRSRSVPAKEEKVASSPPRRRSSRGR